MSCSAAVGCSGRFQLDPGNNLKVVGEDRTPDVTPESFPTFPGTTVKTKGTLERGDVGFDTGAEVSQLPVHPGALGHVDHRQTSLLGKDHVLDLQIFCRHQVVV